MRIILKLTVILSCLLSFASCKKGGEDTPVGPKESFEGLVINEVSPSKIIGAEGWFELYNKSDRTIRLNGLKIMLLSTSDDERQLVATLSDGVIEPSSWFVVDAAGFSKDMLRATFEELTICDTDGYDVNSFNVKFDYGQSKKPEDGGSYSRIPDGKGQWTVTATASPGYANYVITPYDITGVVINEVCPAGKWVEIANGSKYSRDMEYSYLKTAAGQILYKVPAGVKLAPGERFVIECPDAALGALEYWSNTDKKVCTFSSQGLPDAPEGTSWSVLPDITGTMRLSSVATKNEVNRDQTTDEDDIVLNEVSWSGKWVEIFNPSVRDVASSSMKLYGVTSSGTENLLCDFGSCQIASNTAKVVSADLSSYNGLVLKSSAGTQLDKLMFSDVDDGGTKAEGTSWARLPNGKGKWYTIKTPTREEANYGIAKGNTRAVWMFSSSMDTKALDDMCKAGIGHLLVNEYALESGMSSAFKKFIQDADARGQKVHVWVQCFYHGGTWTPATVVDEKDASGKMIKGHMNQEAFDEIIARATSYMSVHPYGIHFDYIRFGGSGAKYNGGGLTPYDSITEFTRQVTTKLREIDPDIVLSAALMGEKNNSIAYGQNCNRMSEYLDIILPMSYISSYNYSYAQNASVATWFAENVKKGTQVWHGFSTYDSSSKGLTAEQMLKDVQYVADHCPKVAGMGMFRYGIGTFPDFSGLFENTQQ